MKKLIFIIPLIIIMITVWSSIFKIIMDDGNSSVVNSKNSLDVVREANENFADRIKESKKEKYSGEEGYQIAVKQGVITYDFLLGDWEGIGEVSNEKSTMRFSMTDLNVKLEDEPVMHTTYNLNEEYGIQFLDLKGEFGEVSVKIKYIDDNTIHLYFPNTSDSVRLVRKN